MQTEDAGRPVCGCAGCLGFSKPQFWTLEVPKLTTGSRIISRVGAHSNLNLNSIITMPLYSIPYTLSTTPDATSIVWSGSMQNVHPILLLQVCKEYRKYKLMCLCYPKHATARI